MRTIRLMLTSIFIICLFFLASCSEDSSPTGPSVPSASFIMDKTSAEVGEVIQLTNQSENASSYRWDFGDENISTEENPTHSYLSNGNFIIKLTAFGEGGSDSTTKNIEIIIPTNIIPGVSAMNISLDETWATVETKMGSDYTQYGPLLITGSGGSLIVHPIESKPKGIYLYLLSSTGSFDLNTSDVVFLIILKENFIGKTELEIKIGNSLTEVESAYGSPEEHDTVYDKYEYGSIGISFYYDASLLVDEMSIYTASGSTNANISNLNIKNYIEDLRKGFNY